MRIYRTIRIASTAALCAGLSACTVAAVPEPRQQPPAALKVPVAPGQATFSARWPVLEGFQIDVVQDRAAKLTPLLTIPAVMRRCTTPEPAFAFDSDVVDSGDEAGIAALSACLTRGPFRDRSLELVGRADARGDPYYNLALGHRRAEHVKRVLVEHGVPAHRVVVATRGARDAVAGLSGYTYEDDRRVDVLLTD